MEPEPPPDVLAAVGEQLRLAGRAYEACLTRHAAERRQCETQVFKLVLELQKMSSEMACPAAMHCFKDRVEDAAGAPVQPPPAAKLPSFLLGDVAARAPAGELQADAELRPMQMELDLGRGQSEISSKVAGAVQFVSDKTSDCHLSPTGMPAGVVRQRLLMRLGRSHVSSLITGQNLHQAVSALGLERYSVAEMDRLVQKLAVIVNLQFRLVERVDKPRLITQISHMSRVPSDFHHRVSPRRTASSLSKLAEHAEWRWPQVSQHSEWAWADGLVNEPTSWGLTRAAKTGVEDPHRVIPLQVLIKAMTVDDADLKKLLGSELCEQLFAIKEVLVTGDANRLVAELTCVRIDDLATKKPQSEWSVFEPLVGMLVVANGIAVGFQADANFADWQGWLSVDIAFTVTFLVEMLVRQAWYGVRDFWCGPDALWNLFDVFLLGVGIAECCLTAATGSDVPALAIVRVVRLVKLARLVRVFRLAIVRELQLMVKGLMGGLRTLCWAFVLLCFVLYVLGVITYSILEDNEDENVRELFRNVPSAMFTVFRCVSGDCFMRTGSSLTSTLVLQYGLAFSGSFFLAYITITLGVFNVILAIYVEITMTAAKQAEGRQERESIRVAHITKRLLKVFCAAEEAVNRSVGDGASPSRDMVKHMLATDVNNTDINTNTTAISKELFLIVIQEPEVQGLMDQLDIPPDRANLFDSIDATGSGSLHASELVMGLLKVRGEVKRSDQVACILALRALQTGLRQVDAAVKRNQRMLEHLAGSYRSLSTDTEKLLI